MEPEKANKKAKIILMTIIVIVTPIVIVGAYFLIKWIRKKIIMKSTTWDKLPYINKVTENQQAFGEKVISISADLELPTPSSLMIVMNNESGENSHIKNMAGGSATGLIQFTEKTAHSLGTTTAALAAMSNLDQLDYVKKYFEPFTGKLKTTSDVYLAVFFPEALSKDNSWVFPDWAVAANPPFFTIGNTKQDFINYVNTKYSQYV